MARRRFSFTLLCPILVLFAGCHLTRHSAPRATGSDTLGWMQSTFAAGSGRTAIFCLSGDDRTKRRMETAVAADMKSRGFDAYAGRALFPRAEHYSAEDLAALLRKNGFQSVGEITFEGDVRAGGTPDNLQFTMQTLPKPKEMTCSHDPTTFDLALRALLEAVVQAGAK